MNIEKELKFGDNVILEIDGKRYQLTNSKGKLQIAALDLGAELVITAKCSNIVNVNQQKW